MHAYKDVVTKDTTPRLQSLKDDMIARRDKDFFWPNGTQVYCGKQGSGKTVSAVAHLMKIKKRYPKAIVVSNLHLNFMKGVKFNTEQQLVNYRHQMHPDKHYIYFSTLEQLGMALTKVNNERLGVIYIIDEIHTYFNALDSKNIPMYIFTEISQQRKQRKLIIGTSQLFLRMAKPFREQCDSLIICKTRLGVFTTQRVYDGMSIVQMHDGSLVGDKKKSGWFWHTRKIRNSFDTYQKVVSGEQQYENEQLVITDKVKKPRFTSKIKQ